MSDVIQHAFVWLMSLGLDRRSHGVHASHLYIFIGLAALAIVLAFSWKAIAYRSAFMRRGFMPQERFAGRYLQALWRNGEIRYSILTILFNARQHRYEVTGRSYDGSGRLLAEFRSIEVALPPNKDGSIEFVWQAGSPSEGFTKMILEECGDDYLQGAGHIITFGAWPRAYPVRFKSLNNRHVRSALGIGSPVNFREEPAFVRKFHAAFGVHVMEGFCGGRTKEHPFETSPIITLPAQPSAPVRSSEPIQALASGEYPS